MASRFAGFEEEVRIPWEDGWYSGVIIPEYESSGSFARVHKTEDVVTTAGDSRNLKLCVTLVNKNETKNMNITVNYRPEALDPERMETLRSNKTAKVRGAGVDFRDTMSLTRLHELEKAGITIEDNGHGGFDVEKMLGTTADFYMSTRYRAEGSKDDRAVTADEKKKATTPEDRKGWFHKITQVAPVDTKVKR